MGIRSSVEKTFHLHRAGGFAQRSKKQSELLIVMELSQRCLNPYDSKSVVTICDANITKFLSGKYHILHVCFLKDLPRVPIMGLASYNYDDIWEVDIGQLGEYYSSFCFGRNPVPNWLESEGIAKGDVVQIDFKIGLDELSFRLGKNRKDWTCPISTKFDPLVKISLIVESPKENFIIIRDDLYLDYVLYGSPRTPRYCKCCEHNDRVIVAQCGHYMCAGCWKKWHDSKPQLRCWICSEAVQRHAMARIRDTPCPIDHCRSEDAPKEFILVPCGCVVRCIASRSEDGKDYCPYEICGKRVEEMWQLFGH
ncbi:hypothetical protein Q1695_004675 [Nippostrongylus brasiliensis]|nr:hypothetical protein Q1695_004675 [Nippostrongylus brasiliensis]